MEKTAKQLVQLTRSWTKNFNQIPIRDGFDTDGTAYPDVYDTYLLWLNEAQNELLKTGYAICNFSYQMNAGQGEYGADAWMHEVTTALYNGVPITRTTIGKLDRQNPTWRKDRGTPQQWYMVADQIGLWPIPNLSDPSDGPYSLVIRADSEVAELALETDKPKRLPSRFHRLLAVGAALFISVQDTENENIAARIGYLKKLWAEGFAELQELTQQREVDQSDQIEPLEYRQFYRN